MLGAALKSAVPAALVVASAQALPHQAEQGKLVGSWLATSEGNIVRELDGRRVSGDSTRAALRFTADGKATIVWHTSLGATTNSFTYRLAKPNLLVISGSTSKPARYRLQLSNNTLSFKPYPISKHSQESIDLICTLVFIKQR